ncbi:MAG TPA: rhomboid family intramembrane serine protease [Planctomycetota bacterium]|nr:rhomboid family intramembrane serine protease [Planctomycetota bacterium]
MIPVGDYPNPRSPQWVTRILVGLNVLVFVFVTMPLKRPLDQQDLSDPVKRELIREIAEVHASREGRRPDREDVMVAVQDLSKYDLVVFRYGYKPGKPNLLALFSCMFLHADFLHIFGNMLMLWIFGDNVEARLGRLGYLVAYLVTGVVATLSFALVSAKSLTPLIGASGAISGVLGFYLIWFPRNQIRVLILYFYFLFIHVRAFWVLGIYLVIQNLLPFLMERRAGGGGVAHGAHIGGFVAGMVGALLFNMFRGKTAAPYPLPYVERRAAPWSRPQRPVPGAAADAFHAAVQMGRMEDAAHAFTRHVTEGGPPPLPADVFALGRWLYENGFATDAAAVFRFYIKSYARGEDLDRVHLGLGVLLARRLGQPAAAREHLLTAVDLARDATVAAKAREELAALG